MNKTKTVIRLAIVAALYVVITLIGYPTAFEIIQFRISEVLILLCFYRKDYAYGLIIGCFIANFFSPMILLDITFGTLATALTVLCVMFSKNIVIASLFPVIFNGIIVGIELNYAFGDPLLLAMLSVAIGEFVVVGIVGVILFKILEKNADFLKLIQANQNLPRVIEDV